MNPAAMTEFPPIALYIALSLAVAILSVVVSFYQEATTATLRKEWDFSFYSFIFYGFFAWLHLTFYLLWQLYSSPSSAVPIINQIVHFLTLTFFGHALGRMFTFWARKRLSEKIMLRNET